MNKKRRKDHGDGTQARLRLVCARVLRHVTAAPSWSGRVGSGRVGRCLHQGSLVTPGGHHEGGRHFLVLFFVSPLVFVTPRFLVFFGGLSRMLQAFIGSGTCWTIFTQCHQNPSLGSHFHDRYSYICIYIYLLRFFTTHMFCSSS